MSDSDVRDIPAKLRPNPGDYAFDLQRALSSVVGIRTSIPADACTAGTLGDERAGSGVVIRQDGLVLTIGYLVIEAEKIWISSSNGRAVPGDVIASDPETGLGLVQALGQLGLPAMSLGDASSSRIEDPVIIAAGGDPYGAMKSQIAARQEFAAYWEYLVPGALFLAPAHPFWGGAAVIGTDGRLLGIGSLHMQQATERGTRRDVNMAVPIDVLPPIFDELLTYGRQNKPPRPWIGLYCAEADQAVVVAGLVGKSPAQAADIREGDTIISVDETRISDLASLWRRIWSSGPTGAEISIRVMRDNHVHTTKVKTGDRADYLKRRLIH